VSLSEAGLSSTRMLSKSMVIMSCGFNTSCTGPEKCKTVSACRGSTREMEMPLMSAVIGCSAMLVPAAP